MSEIPVLDREIPRERLIDDLRRLRPDLTRLGVTRMSLFGSRARGDNRLDSDIDLIVDVAAERKFSLLDLIAVAHAVEDDIGLPANIFMRRSLEPSFLTSARNDEVVIFGE